MTFLKKGTLALAIVCAGLTASAFAATSQPSTKGYALTDSSQTFVLTANAPQYDAWAKWIKEQDLTHKKSDGSTWGAGQVGQVTIITTAAHQVGSDHIGVFDVPPDNGPPGPLPTTGTPGQRIKIVNQTATTYQAWIFVWIGESGDGGGWSESSYAANSCAAGNETGKLCPNQPDG